MSSDGILTVTVPKTTSGSKASAVSEASTSQVSQTSSQNTDEKQTLTKVSKSEQQSFRSEHQNTSTRRTEATSSLANKITSEENQEGANSRICESGSSLLESTQSSKDAVDDQWLPISSKGQFFSDSFFEDVRKDFETAVNEVLSRHDIMRSANDELSCYRSLRERELKDETQAMKTTEDQHGFKLLKLGGVGRPRLHERRSVKVVDNKEVVVEGRAEKNDGTLRSSKSFCRRFTLPGAVDMNAVTSAMSSDGVLTITAPKV
nr:alpha-crystallin A chain-like [Penaeus vannamei]